MSRWLLENPKPDTAYMRDWLKTDAGKAYKIKQNLRAKEWRKKNKEKFHSKQKENYDAIRLEALIHYSQDPPICACPDCGISDIRFLQLDHTKGDGAKQRRLIGQTQGDQKQVKRQKQKVSVGGNGLPYWLKKHKWPKGFQVLCANCNYAKRTAKFCPVHGEKI